MTQSRSLISVAGWDGFLPLGTAVVPFLVKLTCPRNDIAQIMAGLIVPMIVAVARSSMIGKQMAQACRGRRPWHRQLFAAAAIFALLIFEVGVGIAAMAGDNGAEGWTLAVIIYMAYVLLIYLALRPMDD